VAPELCVEIWSLDNSDKEMQEKKALYFEKGATEAWFCDTDGKTQFFRLNGNWQILI